MADSLPATVAGVVLAAGAGTRLAPLTRLRPKALCPVGNVALVDLAVERVGAALGAGADRVAVNVHHGRDQMEAHLAWRAGATTAAGDVHVSIEEPEALGTAGAIGQLRGWIAGRGALIVNADAWCPADLGEFVAGWDGERVRIMAAGSDPFGPRSAIVASLLPWSEIEPLRAVASGLYECCWRAAAADGRVDTVAHAGAFIDCGTPAQYLAANLAAVDLASAPDADAVEAGSRSLVAPDVTVDAGAILERSVVGEGARIAGRVRRSVVWSGASVDPGETLEHAIRTDGGITVLVR